MNDFSSANPPAFQPYQLDRERNDAVRNALTCPRCKRSGGIVPERKLDRAFALTLRCSGVEGAAEGCGSLGVFEPDPELWTGLDRVKAVAVLQAWLDGLSVSALPDDAISQLGALELKDREIEGLRAHLAKLARRVHQSYHHESYEDSWQKCPYPTCNEARTALGIITEPG